jgi:hypothetical protein
MLSRAATVPPRHHGPAPPLALYTTPYTRFTDWCYTVPTAHHCSFSSWPWQPTPGRIHEPSRVHARHPGRIHLPTSTSLRAPAARCKVYVPVWPRTRNGTWNCMRGGTTTDRAREKNKNGNRGALRTLLLSLQWIMWCRQQPGLEEDPLETWGACGWSTGAAKAPQSCPTQLPSLPALSAAFCIGTAVSAWQPVDVRLRSRSHLIPKSDSYSLDGFCENKSLYKLLQTIFSNFRPNKTKIET